MTVEQNDLIMRPIAGCEELTLFSRLPYVLNQELMDDLAVGRRRPEWMWVAVRGDHLLARVAWWGRTGDDIPFLLDIFDIDDSSANRDRVDIGVRLLRAATAAVVPAEARPPEYNRAVPPDWREDDVTGRIVEDRMLALERTGARISSNGCFWSGVPGRHSPSRRGAWRSGRSATPRKSSP